MRSSQEALTIQELKEQLITKDDFEWNIDSLSLVGGVDISFNKHSTKDACASLVVVSYPSMKIVYQKFKIVELTLPYIPGFLAFREVSFLVDLIEELKREDPQLVPQLILVDGNGILHTRGFGLASHLGVLVNIPTIGVGKKLFVVDGLDDYEIQEQVRRKLHKGGEFLPLIGKSGKVWGAALKSCDSTQNPVFVSIGHRISLETAVLLTSRMCKHRVPEPIRQADLGSRREIKKVFGN